MFEYLGQAILSVDFLGLGASIILIMFTFGVSYLFAQGRMDSFLFFFILINYAISALIFIGYKEANFAIVTTIAAILILMLPDGTKETIFKDVK